MEVNLIALLIYGSRIFPERLVSLIFPLATPITSLSGILHVDVSITDIMESEVA